MITLLHDGQCFALYSTLKIHVPIKPCGEPC